MCDAVLSDKLLETNLREILIEIQTFSVKKMYFKTGGGGGGRLVQASLR